MLMTGVGWDGIRKEYVLNRFFFKKSFYKAFQRQLCRGTFVFMSEYSLFRLQLWGFASVGELVQVAGWAVKQLLLLFGWCMGVFFGGEGAENQLCLVQAGYCSTEAETRAFQLFPSGFISQNPNGLVVEFHDAAEPTEHHVPAGSVWVVVVVCCAHFCACSCVFSWYTGSRLNALNRQKTNLISRLVFIPYKKTYIVS